MASSCTSGRRKVRCLTSGVLLAAAGACLCGGWSLLPGFVAARGTLLGCLVRHPGRTALSATDGEKAPPTQLVVVSTGGGGAGVRLELSRTMESSVFETVSAEIPLGLKITQEGEGDLFIVEEILPGGSIAQGEAIVKEGDVVHAVSTEANGKKGIVETKSLADTDELTEALLGNDDGQVTLVLERQTAPGGPGNIGFLTDVARMF